VLEKTQNNPAYSPERYLAIAAGAHSLVERIPQSAYPIADWDALARATATVGDITLRGPGGLRVPLNDLTRTIAYIRPLLGDQYFPVHDADDLAHKAGMALVSLVVRRHAPRGMPVELPPDADRSEIEALQRKVVERRGAPWLIHSSRLDAESG
jgi:hypothetical protein